MERELWKKVYRMVVRLGRTRRRPGVRFADAAIVLVQLWAVLHDRPISRACEGRNWAGRCSGRRPARLPSNATMSRRLRSASVREFYARIEERLRGCGPEADLLAAVDGKALAVSAFSRDPDAKVGYGTGRMSKGYKLYAVWGVGPLPLAWEVRGLNESEPAVAAELLARVGGAGYVVGDAVYDVNPLYEAAAARGRQLIAPRKRPGGNLGHRRHSPRRLRSIELLARPFGRALLRMRDGIERHFARLTNVAGGLGPLPNWVRRLPRVGRWVHAKLLLHAIRFLPEPAS